MPKVGDHMQPLKDAIYNKLIPTLTCIKHEMNDPEQELVMLPVQFGGMSFEDPVDDSRHKYVDSIKCTASLTQQILES